MEHNHSFDIHKFFHNQYNDLLTSDALRGFGLGIISLFLPLFLISKGYSLLDILLFEVLFHIFSLGLHFAIIRYSKILHLKVLLAISYACVILFFILLYSIDSLGFGKYVFLGVIYIVNLFEATLYWVGHHFYFIKATRKKESGEKLSLLVGIPVLLSVASPLLGSFLISKYGFNLAFFTTMLFLCAAGLLMFFTQKLDVEPKFKAKEVVRGESRFENASYFFEGIVLTTVNIIWPLLLFFSAITIPDIGIIFFVGNILYAILSYMAGKMTDEKKFKKMLTLGAAAHGGSVIARAFVKSISVLIGLQAVAGVFAPLWTIPAHTLFYKKAHRHASNQILNRELYLHTGKICYIAVLCVALIFHGPQTALFAGLILGGLAEFLMLFSLRNYVTENL